MADFVDAVVAESSDGMPAAEVVPIGRRRAAVNHATVVAGGHQPDGRQGPDHAILAATESLEPNAVACRQFPGFVLRDQLCAAPVARTRSFRHLRGEPRTVRDRSPRGTRR